MGPTETPDVRELPYEESTVFKLGDEPGACWGWECADCQGSSGLAYGDPDRARGGLTVHQASDCVEFPAG